MKAAILVALAAAGCADLLDIPDRHAAADSTCSGTIHLRLLYDATGDTKDVGRPFLKGQLDLLREIIQNGGIRGC